MSVQSPPGQSAQPFSSSNTDARELEPDEERSSYSAFVLAMKIVLPVLAIILLVSVFVSSTTFNSRPEIVIEVREVDARSEERRVGIEFR